ncbi:MAG: glycosyltransferase family 2 protein [Candidatus Geothermarchaeales archaeon]
MASTISEIELTVGIHTFDRDPALYRCLKSLFENVTVPFQLIVVDDGHQTLEKTRLYERIKRRYEGSKVLVLGYHAGLAKCRNVMTDECDTEYVVILDDDMLVRRGSIRVLRQCMESLGGDCGGVAPVLHNHQMFRKYYDSYAGDLTVVDGTLIHRSVIAGGKMPLKNTIPLELDGRKVRLVQSDMIDFGGLFRTEIFEDARFDERFMIGREHMDFFLQLRGTRWDFYTCLGLYLDHMPDVSSIGYLRKHRFSQAQLARSGTYFNRKWNVRGLISEGPPALAIGGLAPRFYLGGLARLVRTRGFGSALRRILRTRH